MGALQVLSEEEVGRYRSDGFLVPEYRLPGEMVERLLARPASLLRIGWS